MHGTVILVAGDHAASVSAVLAELAAAATALQRDNITLDLLVVDAGSTDGSIEIAGRTADELGLPFEMVVSTGATAWSTQRDAFAHALEHSSPDFLVTLDPAGHHDARQLPDLIRSFRAKGSGLTIGSRWVRGGSAPGTSLPRSLLSRLASMLVARATGFRRVRDVTTSFRVIRPDAADLIATSPASTGDYGFYCEFVAAAQAYGFSVDEVPITFRPRFTVVPGLKLADLSQFFHDVHRIRGRIRSIRAEVAVDQSTWAARSGLLRHQAPDAGSEFGALEELTELSDADHFTDWIVDSFEPMLGARVLEVGAGLGAIVRQIAERRPEADITAIEPAANVFDALARRCREVSNVSVLQITSGDLAGRPDHPTFDSVLYVNVLEHIEHDEAELDTAVRLLDARRKSVPVRSGDAIAVRQPRLQVGPLPPLRRRAPAAAARSCRPDRRRRALLRCARDRAVLVDVPGPERGPVGSGVVHGLRPGRGAAQQGAATSAATPTARQEPDRHRHAPG